MSAAPRQPPSQLPLLRADCARCEGLCCVAPAFARGADFAIDKPAGNACPNLAADARCEIHDDLRPRGFGGCVAYDCVGAGQRAVALTTPASWRDGAAHARRVFDVFEVLRSLHELLWYLGAALALPSAAPVHRELTGTRDAVLLLAAGPADAVLTVDVDDVRCRVNPLLLTASDHARTGLPRADLRGASLVGADLRDRDLRGASLRGALLVGADLRDADLERADLTGTDLRGARLDGADLRDAIFLRPSQLESAQGDHRTRVPTGLDRPAHWS